MAIYGAIGVGGYLLYRRLKSWNPGSINSTDLIKDQVSQIQCIRAPCGPAQKIVGAFIACPFGYVEDRRAFPPNRSSKVCTVIS